MPLGSADARDPWCSRWWPAATAISIAEIDRHGGRRREFAVASHLDSLIPGQRLAHASGELVKDLGHHVAQLLGAVHPDEMSHRLSSPLRTRLRNSMRVATRRTDP